MTEMRDNGTMCTTPTTCVHIPPIWTPRDISLTQPNTLWHRGEAWYGTACQNYRISTSLNQEIDTFLNELQWIWNQWFQTPRSFIEESVKSWIWCLRIAWSSFDSSRVSVAWHGMVCGIHLWGRCYLSEEGAIPLREVLLWEKELFLCEERGIPLREEVFLSEREVFLLEKRYSSKIRGNPLRGRGIPLI